MMSGSGILTNGKGTRREYGDFNLDELRVRNHFQLSLRYFEFFKKIVRNPIQNILLYLYSLFFACSY